MAADIARQRALPFANGARVVVGAIWLGGAIFNAVFSVRHPESWVGFFTTSTRLSIYNWFFGEIVVLLARFAYDKSVVNWLHPEPSTT